MHEREERVGKRHENRLNETDNVLPRTVSVRRYGGVGQQADHRSRGVQEGKDEFGRSEQQTD